MSQPHRRSNLTALDLVRALLPLVALVLVVVWLSTPTDVDPVRAVDPGPELAYAAEVADFEVLAAVDLPEGWVPTSARVEPTSGRAPVTVTVGYVTADGRFAQVVQSADVSAAANVLGEGYAEAGELDVEGVSWTQVETADGEAGLLRSEPDVLVVVTGSASLTELRVLAAALAPL